jgi:hypothetical protein
MSAAPKRDGERVAGNGNGGGASPGEGMALWWTSAVAGEDGDELSGWLGSDEE